MPTAPACSRTNSSGPSRSRVTSTSAGTTPWPRRNGKPTPPTSRRRRRTASCSPESGRPACGRGCATKIEAYGGQLVREDGVDGGLSSWFARGLAAHDLEQAMDAIGLEHAVVRDAPRKMLAALPTLSELEAAMPMVPIPAYSKATLFSLRDASWQTVAGVGIPGAYRVEQSFRRLSIWVDSKGAVERQARVGQRPARQAPRCSCRRTAAGRVRAIQQCPGGADRRGPSGPLRPGRGAVLRTTSAGVHEDPVYRLSRCAPRRRGRPELTTGRMIG